MFLLSLTSVFSSSPPPDSPLQPASIDTELGIESALFVRGSYDAEGASRHLADRGCEVLERKRESESTNSLLGT